MALTNGCARSTQPRVLEVGLLKVFGRKTPFLVDLYAFRLPPGFHATRQSGCAASCSRPIHNIRSAVLCAHECRKCLGRLR
jgi:hypothetical protein